MSTVPHVRALRAIYSLFSVENMSVIITGAGQGMGASAAEVFGEAGARVVVADFNDKTGPEVVDRIKKAGGEAAFFKVDVSDEEQVAEMVKFAVKTYGRLDAAINNAARTPDNKPLAEMDIDAFDAVMNVDLRGVALCLKYELKQMLEQGQGGSIINTASVSGIRPQPGTPAYVAAKHGVIGLTKQAAMDYSPYGIRVNAIAPGAIDTPMLRNALIEFGLEPESYAKELSMLGRFGRPDEIAKSYLWLASDLSSFVTGTTLEVDGGYSNK
ncbi:SDR family NAD(P)-dependent oxidoreductase [Trueperella bialowiezensis]|uniref:Levodione reductase n=1 Tax=Trueperella bialowiezensis TaxID=312285 RepID=A0A448PF63_9ACTO|nr:glucose 1-dehydrogenase [Trueperella bialowiezensis]VEI13591.1 Levodione reductase [Trueperella bialowiezensis]